MEFKSLFKSLTIENTDKTLAIIGIFAATILIMISILVKNNFLYALSGVFILIVSLFWLFIRNNVNLDINLNENKNIIRLLNISFYMLFSLAILSIYLNSELYIRPFAYFFVVSVIFVVLLFEIFYSTKKIIYSILLQILLFGLLLVFSELLIFPTIVGVDTWWHQWFTTLLINTGHIPEDTIYSNLPIFHLEIASTSIISSLNYKYASMFSISFIQVTIDIFFIFLIGKQIFNSKIGLLAALMIVVANTSISMGFAPIPNTLGPPILLIIIYILIKFENITSKLVSLLFMVLVILMHTISAFISVIAIFSGFFASIIYSRYFRLSTSKSVRIKYSFTIGLFFAVTMLGWWIYASGGLNSFLYVFQWGFNADNFVTKPEVQNALINSIPLLEKTFDYLGNYILSSLSILGCFLMINKKFRNNDTFYLALIGLILLGIAFTSNFLGSFIVPERWYYFAFVLLSIPMGISFLLIFKKIQSKVLFGILAFLIAFALVISPDANIDNHMFTPNSVFTSSLSQSELTAINTTGEFWNNSISSDEFFSITVINHLGYKGVDMDNNILSGDFTNQSSNLILIRNRMMIEPIELSEAPYRIKYNITNSISNEGFSKIYDDGSVNGYLYLK